jgi:predicted Zn-dependent peptidase
MNYESIVLPNGIRVIHINTTSQVAHCGLFINTGSRDETVGEYGMAHFIEHVVFKGTKKRKAYHIISCLENSGGELNAYTTKEETVFHASFLKEDLAKTIDLIADITFNSTFPLTEIEKEKVVVIDEINSYKDNPSELIFDDFEDMLFAGHAIGHAVLGKPGFIRKFSQASLHQFIQNNYHTDQMVLCCVGQFSFSRVKELANRHLGIVPQNLRTKGRTAFDDYRVQNKELKKNTHQAHCIIGTTAYSIERDERIGLHLLSNLLAGPGMNSRLNMALRERKGLAYNVEASFHPYADTGIMSVYFGTDPLNLERCLTIIDKELKILREQSLGSLQLHRAKLQVIGHLAISAESNENVMLSSGKSFLVYNKVDSLEEINRKIEQVNAKQLLDIANEIFDPKRLSMLVYK